MVVGARRLSGVVSSVSFGRRQTALQRRGWGCGCRRPGTVRPSGIVLARSPLGRLLCARAAQPPTTRCVYLHREVARTMRGCPWSRVQGTAVQPSRPCDPSVPATEPFARLAPNVPRAVSLSTFLVTTASGARVKCVNFTRLSLPLTNGTQRRLWATLPYKEIYATGQYFSCL